jgi:hypothetical protein
LGKKLSKEVHDILSTDISKAFNFEPRIASKPVYYPHNIGFPNPAPPKYVEFAIVGEQNGKHEAFQNIVEILEKYGALVASLTFANDLSMDQFVMNIVCDLSSAKCPPDELLIRISKSKFVTFAEKSSHEGKIFSSLSFPLTVFGGDVRALALDADRMVTLFDLVENECGPKGGEILFEEGRREGREIVEAVRQKLSESQIDKTYLFENVAGLFQAAGWGRLSIHEKDDEVKVSISDPPSDAGGGRVLGNRFLEGMVAGILEPFHKSVKGGNVKLSLVKELYDAERRILTLHYMDVASIVELSRKNNEQEAKVLEKVEEIIKSLEQSEKGNDEEAFKQEVGSNTDQLTLSSRIKNA